MGLPAYFRPIAPDDDRDGDHVCGRTVVRRTPPWARRQQRRVQTFVVHPIRCRILEDDCRAPSSRAFACVDRSSQRSIHRRSVPSASAARVLFPAVSSIASSAPCVAAAFSASGNGKFDFRSRRTAYLSELNVRGSFCSRLAAFASTST